jgi:hypothetical protein
MDRETLILQEVAIREQARVASLAKIAAIRGELFDKQLAVVDDPAKEKAILCSRRAGKTSMWPRVAAMCALAAPRNLIRIWAISALRCEQMIWTELKLLCERHQLNVDFNNTKHTATFPNGSEIRLLGADKQKEAEKKRGDKSAMEIVIESQLFGSYLETLVEDIAGPCLADLDGTFYLEGTPGPVCAGHWYSVSGGNDTDTRWVSEGRIVNDQLVGAGWSCHRWSLLDNPFPNGKQHWHDWLKAKKKSRRWADDDPTYLREYLGRWVSDLSALFYTFDPIRNTYQPGVDGPIPYGEGWTHVLGWDLGFRDDMALVVWGYHPNYPELYEAFSWKKAECKEAGPVMEEIAELVLRGFSFTTLVADTGGGGKMYVEAVLQRYPYAFQPAKKTDKYDHVRMLNDELRTGFIKVQRGSPLALEMAVLCKDPDWPDPDKPEAPPTEDPRFPNHCCDAGLYSFRAAMHFLHQNEVPRVVPRSPEWYKLQEAAMIAKMEQKRANVDRCWLDQYDEPSSYPGDDDDA